MPETRAATSANVWVHCLGTNIEDVRGVVIQALEHARFATPPLDLDRPSGLGVPLFTEINQQLYESLRAFSYNGRDRVLAVAESRAVLHDGCVWRLLQAGASDVLAWDSAAHPAGTIVARLDRWKEIDALLCSPLVQQTLIGQSQAWRSTLRQVIEVARFTGASVLIAGETGTGKEQVARLIHTLDARPEKRELVVLDCTTIVPELSGSEFFGHERGAFTGAVAARDGAFAVADGGTLFLDEVGELPANLQSQLLRVVQEHTYKRVGSNTWQTALFRLLCATNRDLLHEQVQGRFRSDLYYRIANWICTLPPLRERSEDIIPLAQHFMRQIRPGEEPPELDESVRAYLLTRPYPGNVRDLKQLVSRMMYRHVGHGPITIGAIPEEERPSPEFSREHWHDATFEQNIRRALALGVGLKEIGRVVDEAAIHIALDSASGNLQRAAQILGVTDRALQMRRAARRQQELESDGNTATED
jgi:transcriptional regulator with GAF, ATPase, and Fis domain